MSCPLAHGRNKHHLSCSQMGRGAKEWWMCDWCPTRERTKAADQWRWIGMLVLWCKTVCCCGEKRRWSVQKDQVKTIVRCHGAKGGVSLEAVNSHCDAMPPAWTRCPVEDTRQWNDIYKKTYKSTPADHKAKVHDVCSNPWSNQVCFEGFTISHRWAKRTTVE